MTHFLLFITKRFRCYFLVFDVLLILLVVMFSTKSLVVGSEETSKLESTQTLKTTHGTLVVKSKISPEGLNRFEPLTFTIELQGQSKVSFNDDILSGQYGDFNVVFRNESSQTDNNNSNIVTRYWTLYPTKSGTLILPPIPLAVSFPLSNNTSDIHRVILPQHSVLIPELAVSESSIDEISPNYSHIKQLPLAKLFLAILLSTLLIILIGMFCLKKHRNDSTLISTETPFDRAIRRLEKIKESHDYFKNEPAVYLEIDDVLREFITKAFGIHAQEKTTHELLLFLSQQDAPSLFSNILGNPHSFDSTSQQTDKNLILIPISVLKEPSLQSSLISILTELDLIKFAKRQTTFNDASKLYTRTRNVIEESYALYQQRLVDYQQQIETTANA